MILPKISVVVPSYNQGQYLEATLVSIINQQYTNLELIVVDGGSRDNSVDIIKKYEGYINWWVSEKDKGQSDAINKGFSRVTGEVVTWLCSDDMYTSGALKKVAEHFSNQPESIGLLHGGTILFNSAGKIADDWGYKDPSIERNIAGIAFSQPSAFFRKKYLDIIGPYVNESLHYGMDYDLFGRLACVCQFLPVKDVLSEYRLHESSKSVTDQDKFIGDWTRVFVNLCKNIGWNDLLTDMNESGVIDKDILDFHYPFTFTPDKTILDSTDKKKIMFYHYCYVLKALYWNGHMDKAGNLLKKLRSEYSYDWLMDEKDIPSIIKKLALPGFVLNVLKKIKRL